MEKVTFLEACSFSSFPTYLVSGDGRLDCGHIIGDKKKDSRGKKIAG